MMLVRIERKLEIRPITTFPSITLDDDDDDDGVVLASSAGGVVVDDTPASLEASATASALGKSEDEPVSGIRTNADPFVRVRLASAAAA